MAKRVAGLVIAVSFLVGSMPARADKGSFSASPVSLSQESQKAIIIHNKKEEILILATELRAERETRVLEFIPLPSEPSVDLVEGQPFETIQELLKRKDIRIISDELGKGGPTVSGVEIKLSQKIGVHDVTVVKINDPAEFESWVRSFFKQQNIPVENSLGNLIGNARDYLDRGLNYFVFDSVTVGKENRLIEPLAYRFESSRLYYPLKTSNLVGGQGIIELVLMLPGSFWAEAHNSVIRPEDFQALNVRPAFRIGFRVSSSSRLNFDEVISVYKKTDGFFLPGQKIYLQMLKYSGPYDFSEDIICDISSLPRYAHKISMDTSYGLHHSQKMSDDEIKDFLEVMCLDDASFPPLSILTDDLMLGYTVTPGFRCIDFIRPEEYLVYETVFKEGGSLDVRLEGLPSGQVVLEPLTCSKRLEKVGDIDKALLEDFNKKNVREYDLAYFLPENGLKTLKIRKEGEKSPFSPGETYVSRVGFNPERTKALVYVSHVASPEMGVGYLVLLRKDDDGWHVDGPVSREIY